MASKLPPVITEDRKIVYQPIVVKDREGGYSAQDVNQMLHQVEAQFEDQIRRLEAVVLTQQKMLEHTPDEMAKVAAVMYAHEEDMKAALDAFQQSLSWRITRPLRWFKEKLRRPDTDQPTPK